MDELVSEVLGALCCVNQLRNQGEGDRDVFVRQVPERIQSQVHNISFGHLACDLFNLFLEACDVKRQVENSEHVSRDHTGGRVAAAAVTWPLLHGQELVVPEEGAQEFETVFEYFLEEGLILKSADGVVEQSHEADEALGGEVSLRSKVEHKVYQGLTQLTSLLRVVNQQVVLLNLTSLASKGLLALVQQTDWLVIEPAVGTPEVRAL